MKRTLLGIVVAALLAGTVFGQSLQDNQFYRRMVELKRQSEAAFEEGDYPEAKRLAEEAQSYKEQSDQWIATQLTAYRARAALVRVKDRLADASMVNAQVNFPEEYAEGTALYNQAYSEFYDDEDYPASLATSNRALEILSVVRYIPSEGGRLPAFYQVRLLPGNTDCLWNIAGYDFIYGDPWAWKLLYEANRDKLPEEANPDLILPEMILTIPAREGESRSGTWVNGEIR